MIRFKCPMCSATLGVPERLAGKAGQCPYCKGRVTVPAGDPPDDEPIETEVVVERPSDRVRPAERRRAPDRDEDEPRRRPRPAAADDEPPRRRRAKDEDDEDDRPRRRRDDEDEDDRPRPRRRRRRSSGEGIGMGGWLIGGGVVLGISVICGLAAFAFPPLALVPVGVGWLMAMAGGIMFLVVAFQEDVMQGILCLCVPFYSLVYLITRFEDVKIPFFIQLAGWAVMMLGSCAGGGSLGGDDAGFPRRRRFRVEAAPLPALVAASASGLLAGHHLEGRGQQV